MSDFFSGHDPWKPLPGDTMTAARDPHLPLRPRRRPRRAPLVVSLIVLAAVAVGAYAIVTNRQHIVDQWTVWNFEASAVVTGYVDRSSMTDHGEFLFLASQPTVTDGEKFNSVCANQEEGSGVLGCYTSKDKVITLFDVTDPQLDGIEEVVAAHEMLHAAWDRMSTSQRADVEPLLEAEYSTLKDDPDFAARMAIYARTEPGQRLNELHSIIGTEVADLPPALETYYSQYFTDRGALVSLHVKSNGVFVELEAKSAALVAELDALRTGIETDSLTANSSQEKLNRDIQSFNAKADEGGFLTQEGFNAARAALLSRQDALDATFDDIQSRIASFDTKSAQLEELNSQAAALNTALNIAPRPSESIDP